MSKIEKLADELKEKVRAEIQKQRIERFVIDAYPPVTTKVR